MTPTMDCEEKVRLLTAYTGCVAHLSAKLEGLEKVTLWQEYSARLHAALEECDLAYFKFKQHVSEHGC